MHKPKIISINKTNDVFELVKIYSAADVLFNPTKEDNFPTVNLEAESCGTPVVTYNTGGCAETIHLKDSVVVSNFEEGYEQIRALLNI